MNYSEHVNKIFKEKGWDKTAGLFRELNGKKVLIFTHDDPDGLSSGCILKKIAAAMGADVTVKLPATYELEESRLVSELEKDNYNMVVISDKGTMGYYDNYAGFQPEIVVIDHHPPIGDVKKCRLINPNIGEYNMCSTSYLAHMLGTYLGALDDYDDFLALIGMKGDWAVEPATDIVSDYVKLFYDEKILGKFDNLIKKINSKPTMFEVAQREKTTLLNQIAELYFALGGGGFQYFYNDRDEKLRDIYQPELSFRIMEEQRNNFNPDWAGLDDFINETGEPEKVRLIYNFFLEDWGRAVESFSSAALLSQFKDTDAYFFIGQEVPLMPMAGSVYLNKLAEKSGGRKVIFIMLNRESSGSLHFSIRGTADDVHSGKICSNLAKRLVEKYNNRQQITGGGHYRAAECKTRKSPVRLSQALEVFSQLVLDMERAAESGSRETGAELGLEYL